MPTEAKRATVAELRDDLAGSSVLITTEYRGLRVREIGEIRRALRKNNVTYRVVKNRLMRIAAEQEGNAGVATLLHGPSAIAFGSGDEAAVAKSVLDAVRPYKLVKVTGAVVGGRAMDAAGVQMLATLPPREVLLAQMAGAFNTPATQVAGLLAANLRNLGSVLAQLSEQKAQTGA
ncbi:MAG: 50S ribosomal protein L10 [Chloroflexi bacterium]|jgi:large subunit ribosomal protein L10|nr:50S ribosomal protein L10 [Chloroflexota bacterium]